MESKVKNWRCLGMFSGLAVLCSEQVVGGRIGINRRSMFLSMMIRRRRTMHEWMEFHQIEGGVVEFELFLRFPKFRLREKRSWSRRQNRSTISIRDHYDHQERVELPSRSHSEFATHPTKPPSGWVWLPGYGARWIDVKAASRFARCT